MNQALKMFISVKKKYKFFFIPAAILFFCAAFLLAKSKYQENDFGRSFGNKATLAKQKLDALKPLFETCSAICKADSRFMQAVIFPEVMRYNSLKDGIEAESLRTLYVQFGQEYANFSIGIFQMKPSFAEQVEEKVKRILPVAVTGELQLQYNNNEEEAIRMERVERLQNEQWQLVYLTAFLCICNETYKERTFVNELEKLQWYATVYNAGFDKTSEFIVKKIKQENFYLQQNMPGKKFKYAAIAGWFYKSAS
ncbi:MAG: hypothetical protein H7Y86_21400 [Rhizobacter sp.]|nr:hypothetical protein [Ferruginibacter sp.]